MLEEDLFDLARVDVVSASHDHVLLAVDDVEVALLVHPGYVPGVEPAVPYGARRLLRHVPVALHDLWSLDYELPALPDWHLVLAGGHVRYTRVGARDGDADATLPADPGEGRVEVRDRGGLGEPVTLDRKSTRLNSS